MIICIHCALEAFVKADGAVPGPPTAGHTDESTVEEHMQRHHPNGVDPAERRELERKAGEIIARLKGGE